MIGHGILLQQLQVCRSGDGTGRLWRYGEKSGSAEVPSAVLRHAPGTDTKSKEKVKDVASLDWSVSRASQSAHLVACS
jgi:hypothetical protein